MDAEPGQQSGEESEQMLGGVLQHRYLGGQVKPLGAATAGLAIAVGAQNPLADGTFEPLRVLFVNKAMGDKLAAF